MAYIITYTMLTGTWRREVATAEAAVAQFHELKTAGAGDVRIHDGEGRLVSVTDLAAPPPAAKRWWWGKRG